MSQIIQKRKVVICGTHPEQFNGYSKVVYELSKELCKYDDIKLYIFGFQNFYQDNDHKIERQLPDQVEVIDAYSLEDPKSKGFGEKIINEIILKISPDIVIVYNDLLVISTFIKNILEIPERKFKLIPYIDLVYRNERQALIDYINKNCDGGIAFTEFWKSCLLNQEFTKPLWKLEHGFNPSQYFPIPKRVARKYFELNEDDFIILNLNRNQPRKRWDVCIKAFVKFISEHLNEKIKLLIMTSITGAWDLLEIMKYEANSYNLSLLDLKSHFTFIQNPQKMTDHEINIMYNAADIGWNTCDGEGFGLCNFEQAGIGCPQIVPNVGGFKDFFNAENALLVDPVIGIHGDLNKDACGGEMELCLVDDYVKCLETYYTDDQLRRKHGKQARKDVLKYTWKDKASMLRNIIIESTEDLFPVKSSDIIESINEMISSEKNKDSVDSSNVKDDDLNIDIDKLINEKLSKIKPSKNDMESTPPPPIDISNLSQNELLSLQRKIDAVLATPVAR
jgi:glycosyltransferase involved in cell wall biosynthesis